jgi:hypothetical protein
MPLNKEAKRIYDADYRKRNLEQLKVLQKQYYQDNAAARKAYMRLYRERFPRKARSAVLKATFGITLDDYDQILLEQNGGCAICGTPPKTKRLSIDHDHTTGRIRGLLCNDCNAGLGFFQESVGRFRRALAYMVHHANRI